MNDLEIIGSAVAELAEKAFITKEQALEILYQIAQMKEGEDYYEQIRKETLR